MSLRPLRAVPNSPMAPEEVQAWLLRLGLAFVFVYASLSSLVDPTRFSRFMPEFLPDRLVHDALLPLFAGFELLLALAFVVGRHLFAASMLSAFTLLCIIVFNPHAFDVLFRNVAIACAALALAVHARTAEAGAQDGSAPKSEETLAPATRAAS